MFINDKFKDTLGGNTKLNSVGISLWLKSNDRSSTEIFLKSLRCLYKWKQKLQRRKRHFTHHKHDERTMLIWVRRTSLAIISANFENWKIYTILKQSTKSTLCSTGPVYWRSFFLSGRLQISICDVDLGLYSTEVFEKWFYFSAREGGGRVRGFAEVALLNLHSFLRHFSFLILLPSTVVEVSSFDNPFMHSLSAFRVSKI